MQSNYIYQLDVVDYKQKVAKSGNTQIKYKYVQIVLQCSTDVTDVAIIYHQCNIHVESIRYFGQVFKDSFRKYLFLNNCPERFECWSCNLSALDIRRGL